MPIYRLSAQEIQGFVINNDWRQAVEEAVTQHRIFATLVRRVMLDYNIRPVVCPPGIINITPSYWRHNRAEHIVEVLPDAESALYHIVPKDNDRPPVPYTRVSNEILAQDIKAVRSIRIPEESPLIPVAGMIDQDPRLRVHEIIACLPPLE